MEGAEARPGFATGLEGIISILRGLIEARQGVAIDPDEALVLSGQALRHYVYDPALNLDDSDPDPEDWEVGSLFCNFGAFESLGYFYGADIKEFNALKPDDFWALLCYELEAGRPMISAGMADPDGELQPVLVVDARPGPGGARTVHVLRHGGRTAEVDLADTPQAQGTSKVLKNWCVIVRPGQRADWITSSDRQRLELLRWAHKHAHNPRGILP